MVIQRFVDEAVTAAGLRARYAQSHRHYHTLVHVEHVLAQISEFAPSSDDIVALQLATWFHDAIYAPGRHDNEERSAFLAKETLEVIGAPPALGDEVARLVTLTSTHIPDDDDRAGAMLCDADLSILGSAPDTYATYVLQIRAEYALIPETAFRAGRATLLRAFLERPALFHTPMGQDRWEATARSNISAEVAELEGAER